MKLVRLFPLVAVLTFLVPLAASALMITGDSLHGSTGELTVIDNGSNSIVMWSLDTTNFDDAGAIATNHQYLTDVAFKIDGMTSVTLAPVSLGAGDLYFPSNVSQGSNGCDTDGSNAGFACLALSDPIDATINQTITFAFLVEGDLDLSEEVSFRGKYGEGRGWVISENGAGAVPEPSAALLFMAGILAVGHRTIRR